MAASPATVILLHGIWMRAPALLILERRLRAAGFNTARFDYASVFGTPQQAIMRLQRHLRAAGPGPVHLLGHSLGGLLAIATCRECNDLPPGRILCLGSPLAGSATAGHIARLPSGRWMLGGWRDVLLHGAGPAPVTREVGAIAGTRAQGLGAMLRALPRPHDGTVALAETHMPWLSDHLAVAASHTGMLLSRLVAEAAVTFLRDGEFSKLQRMD